MNAKQWYQRRVAVGTFSFLRVRVQVKNNSNEMLQGSKCTSCEKCQKNTFARSVL
eukprot:TRINITY_DN4669_c0_g1_i1.p1 TRINITY_DN4669_c0_g1~~TRINITY_DN4669_c0_g1_i1.p1  ORF type:complete len:55 (+),score=11.45 TRINITY_DN4669_c0_g1_i1:273-437(+)